MRVQDDAGRRDPGAGATAPLGRRTEDRTVGAAARAGRGLGPEDPDLAPTPMPPNQHRFAGAPFATDAAQNYHGIDDRA